MRKTRLTQTTVFANNLKVNSFNINNQNLIMSNKQLKKQYYDDLSKVFFMPKYESRAINKISIKRLVETPEDWTCPFNESMTHRAGRVSGNVLLPHIHKITDFVIWKKTGKHMPFEELANSQWYCEVLYVIDRDVFNKFYTKESDPQEVAVNLQGFLATKMPQGTVYQGNILTSQEQRDNEQMLLKNKIAAEKNIGKLLQQGLTLQPQRDEAGICTKFVENLGTKVKKYVTTLEKIFERRKSFIKTTKAIIKYHSLHIRAIVSTVDIDQVWKEIPMLLEREIAAIMRKGTTIKTYENYMEHHGYPMNAVDIMQIYNMIQRKRLLTERQFFTRPEEIELVNTPFNFDKVGKVLLEIAGIINRFARLNKLSKFVECLLIPNITQEAIERRIEQMQEGFYSQTRYIVQLHTNTKHILRSVKLTDSVAIMICNMYEITYTQMIAEDFALAEFLHEQVYRLNKATFEQLVLSGKDLTRFVTENLLNCYLIKRQDKIKAVFVDALKESKGETKLYHLAELLTQFTIINCFNMLFSGLKMIGIEHFYELFVLLQKESEDLLDRNNFVEYTRSILVQALSNIAPEINNNIMLKHLDNVTIADLSFMCELLKAIATMHSAQTTKEVMRTVIFNAFQTVERTINSNKYWVEALQSLIISPTFNYHIVKFRPENHIVTEILKQGRTDNERNMWREYTKALCGLIVLRETLEERSEDYIRINILIKMMRRMPLDNNTAALINIASLFVTDYLNTGARGQIVNVFRAFDILLPDTDDFVAISVHQKFLNEMEFDNVVYCKRALDREPFTVTLQFAARLLMCFCIFTSDQQHALQDLYAQDIAAYVNTARNWSGGMNYVRNMVVA